jgi:hypothetical protein
VSATVSQEPNTRQLTRPFHEKEQSVVVMDFCLFLLASTAPSPSGGRCGIFPIGCVALQSPPIHISQTSLSFDDKGRSSAIEWSIGSGGKEGGTDAGFQGERNGQPARKARAIDVIVRARPPARKSRVGE